MPAQQTDRYDVFLSYGHAADRALAPVLQSGLERYARPWYGRRVLRVFRDDTNLAAEPALWDAIVRALEASAWFVLLASPEAARSAWVDREVDWWLTHRPHDHLLVVLTNGEFDEALPPSLRSAGLAEPRWVDLRGVQRGGKVDRLNPTVQNAVVDLTATIRDIPRDDLEGENARRRRRTRWVTGSTIALLSLFLVASLIATVAFAVTNSRLTAALDTANARSLGQDAQQRLATDPDTATQLALAAYRSDPGQFDARNALGQVFLARRSTTAVHAAPDGAEVSVVIGDPAADVTVLGTPSGPVIADGLTGPAPSFAAVPGAGPATATALAGGGRWVVLGGDGRSYRVWDRTTGVTRALPETGSPAASTTPDGAHLITATPSASGTQVRVDDLASGASTPLARLPEPEVASVWQTSDPGRILVRAAGGATGSGALTLRDARTGAVLSTLPDGTRVVAGGSLVAACSPDLTVLVSDAATGAPQRRIGNARTSTPCTGYPAATTDGRHLVWTSSPATSTPTVDVVQVADLTDGHLMSAWVPAATGVEPTRPQSPRRDDRTQRGISAAPVAALTVHGDRALLVDGGRIDTLALSPAPTWRNRRDETNLPFTVGDGSTAVLSYRDGSAATVRTADGAPLGTLAPDRMGLLPGETVVDRGSDADRQTYVVVTSSPQGERLRDFALPSFRPLGVYDLVAAGAAGFAGNGVHYGIIEVAGDTVAILADGTLSWWSASTHRLTAPPVPLAGDAARAARIDAANFAGLAISADGDVVGLQEPAGTRPDGSTQPAGVTLWRRGSDQPLRIAADLDANSRSIAITRGRLVTLERPGTLVQRDVVTGAVLAPPVAVSPTSEFRGILGIDATGLLVTDESTDTSATATFWDLDANRIAGTLTLPTGTGPGLLINDRLDADESFYDFASVPVDPRRWHDQLCATGDRPFSDDELAVLPTGTDTDPPCS